MATWKFVFVVAWLLMLAGCPQANSPPVEPVDCGDGAAFTPVAQSDAAGRLDGAMADAGPDPSWAPECSAMCGRLGPAGLNCPAYAPTPRKKEPCESLCTRRLRAGDTNQHFPCLIAACSCAQARDCTR
jgi:hypothetical protein